MNSLEDAEDRQDTLEELGEPVIYESVASGLTTTIWGVFGKPYIELVLNNQPVSGYIPQVIVADEDVPEPLTGDEFTVDGILYKLLTPQPGGSGLTVIILKVP